MKYELVTFADKDSFSWGGHFDFLIGLNFQKSEDAHLFLHWWKTEGEHSFKASPRETSGKPLQINLPETRGEICARCRQFHPSLSNYQLTASITHPENQEKIEIILFICNKCAIEMDIGRHLMSLLDISLGRHNV